MNSRNCVVLLADDISVWTDVAERLGDRYDVTVTTEPSGLAGVHVVAHGRRSVRAATAARGALSRTVVSTTRPRDALPVQWIRPTWRRAVLPVPATGNLAQRWLSAGPDAPRTHAPAVARMIGEFVDGRARTDSKLVFVTGAGSGIGRATALAFAAQGADVLVADLDLTAAEQTAELARANGVVAAAYQADVADSAALGEVALKVVAEHGVPDVVMANAGVAVIGSFLNTTEQEWRRIVDVNLWGVVNTFRAFVPHLVERGSGGHLVVTSSMASFFPAQGQSAYATTKAGVVMLARSLAAELGKHSIGVTALCPGFVRTNIAAHARFAGADASEEARRRAEAAQMAQKRATPPEKVAAVALRAIERNQLIVSATPEARLLSALHRLSPSLLSLLARRMDLG